MLGNPDHLLECHDCHKMVPDTGPCPHCGSQYRLKYPSVATRGRPTPLLLGEQPDVPVLYKFTEFRWALALRRSGCVRVGTLGDFRRVEAHEEGIGDGGEGIALHQAGELWIPNTEAANVGIGPSSGFLKFTTVGFHVTVDAFVLCFAAKTDRTAFPQYSATVEITNPLAFCRAITGSLKASLPDIEFVGIVPCKYRPGGRSRRIGLASTSGIANLSLLRANTNGVRLGTRDPRLDQGPINLTVPALAKLCRVLPPPPNGQRRRRARPLPG